MSHIGHIVNIVKGTVLLRGAPMLAQSWES